MKIYRGTILTLDSRNTVANCLVEDKGRIVYVGDLLPRKYRFGHHEVVHLGKRVLIPSFVDSHIHFASYATFHAGLNVMNARSNAEILDMLRAFLKDHDDPFIVAFGASPYSVEEGRLVSRAELDAVCPDRPLFMVKYDGHACVVNTPLFKRVEKQVTKLRGCHADTGEMNQEAFFAVSDHVTNSVSPVKLVENMQKAADDLARRGIGMIHTVSGVGFVRDLDVDLERWFASSLKHGLQMRVFFQTMDVDKAIKRRLPRIGGCFACALDGCFGSADAALNAPYEGSSDRGVLYYTDEQVTEFCKKANRAGLQIEMHAIGDAAFDQATRAIAAALEDCPRADHRHAIIHACLPTPEGIALCRKYKILLPVQSAFIDWPQEPDAYLREILGKRAERLNPLRTFADNGIVLSAGSDGPCTDPDPMLWVHKAVNHSDPGQALSVYEALRMCTYNGYYTTFDEGERGSLETGKIADMCILSQNPYTVARDTLKDIAVEQLILQGKPYRDQPKGAIAAMLRGVLGKKNC